MNVRPRVLLLKAATVLFAACSLCVGILADKKEPVRDGYKRPQVMVPYAWKKPKIDGIVDDKEWEGAESTNALQTIGGAISPRQTRFWMMWDEENIYMAMRSPLRKGERLLQNIREFDRDINVVFDDSYEIWLSVKATDPLTDQPDCMTQFLCNFPNARYDLLHQPAVGNSRTSYSTGWYPKNRISKDNKWEWELVIPRKSLGETKGPFHDGFTFTCLVARNYKRPWEQNSFEGTSSFSVEDTHSKFIMSKTSPALHLLSVGDVSKESLGLSLKAYGQSDCKAKWHFRSDSGVSKEGVFSVKKGALTDVVSNLAMDKVGDGYFRITVSSEDGKTVYLDWSALMKFGFSRKRVVETANGKKVAKFESVNQAAQVLDDRGDVLKLTASLNPVKDYVRVRGDFIQYDERDKIKDVKAALKDPSGKVIGKLSMKIDDNAYAIGVIKPGKLANGEYTMTIECLDENGGKLAEKEIKLSKKDPQKSFKWWNTKHGNIEKVIKPWTPVEYKDGLFKVWGRTMQVGPAGLPEQITTQGRKILTAPAELVAELPDGKAVKAAGVKLKTAFQQDYRTTVDVSSQLDGINIDSKVMTEFDGLYKITMTLNPRKPTTVKSLKVIIPFTEQFGDYIHAVADEIRSGFFYGFTPKGKGRVWDCTVLGSQSMVVGSFIPYVWLGCPKGGLCWFADSDKGWVPSNKTPAIEIRRDKKGQVDFVLNLISEEFKLTEPRTIVFGLQASPVKKMHKRWREDKWWCGDTFRDYSGVGAGGIIWNSIPFVLPKFVEESKKLVARQHKAGKPAVPYFIHESLPAHLVPEVKYFGEQWKTSIDRCLYYGKTLTDFMVYSYAEWAKKCGIDGLYVDNMRPVLCDNIEAGRGYVLPNGKVQPSYQMFETRRYFLRLRAAFQEQRPESKIVLHMTNSMVIPWVGAADVAYDGEHHVIYPEMKKDFMDFWSLERLRVDFPEQWGTMVNFMHEYQKNWEPRDLHKAMRSYFAAVMLQDVLPTGNNNGHARFLVKAREAFGIGDDNVKFLPYWDTDDGVVSESKDAKTAGWLKPDKLLLLVSNFGNDTEAKVKIDPAKLGWKTGSQLVIKDAEEGMEFVTNKRVQLTEEEIAAKRKELEARAAKAKNKKKKPTIRVPKFKNVRVVAWQASENGPVKVEGDTLSVPVKRHDYRLLIVEPK